MRGGEHHIATCHRPMVQGELLTAHPRGVHGDGWSPGGGSSFRQGAGAASPGSPDLETAVAAIQRGVREYEICFQGFLLGGKNKGQRGHREGPQGSQEAPWRDLGWGRTRDPSGVPVVAPHSFLGDSRGFRDADFLYIFSGIFGALLMAGKPEIQKQQKTGTGNWVHWVNRLVQICSKVYESSSKTWQSHTKHAWSKQKL